MRYIKINNPSLKDCVGTYLTDDFAIGETTITTTDNTGFVLSGTDDYYIMIGDYGQEKTEIVLVDASESNENSFKISATKFSHEASDPITLITYNQIKIYGLSVTGGAKTIIATVDIDTSAQFTRYAYTGSTYSLFVASYYDSENSAESSFSEQIQASSFSRNSAKKIIEAGLRRAMTQLDENANGILNWEIALEILQDGIDEILTRQRKWSFLNTSYETVTVPDQEYIDNPEDLSYLQFLKVNNKQVTYVSNMVYNLNQLNSSGTPYNYTIKDNKCYLLPKPSQAFTVKFDYYKIPTVVENIATTVPAPFKSILIYYCGCQFAYIRGNEKKGNSLYQMFDRNLELQVQEYTGPMQAGEAESIENTSSLTNDLVL